ncbi:MAG: ABC transporter ATP-binding protein [Oscillospiraceae bacterium]|nr:ABC transporter ATP-binding protein [Oscillospiraceae bacterium]
MNENAPVLEVRGLYKSFQRKGVAAEAVSDVSLTLGPGEILGIVGESGSGKSTLLRCIACLEKPTAGKIALCGNSVAGKKPADICRTVQMVFQDAVGSFDPRMKTGASLDEAIRQLTGVSGEAIRRQRDGLIGRVGLDPTLAERYPARLSGGQCQRLAIARAMAGAPKVLLCDEVTSALDVSAQAQIVALLSELRRDLGLSIVFVSHDLALVGGLCDRVVVLEGGHIVEQGTANEILSDPREAYTRQLLSSVLTVEGKNEP